MSTAAILSKKKPLRSAKVITLPAGEFKAKCLRLMDEVRDHGSPIVITKRGREVARLVPPESRESASRPPFFGLTKGSMTYGDDLLDPLPMKWTFDADNL